MVLNFTAYNTVKYTNEYHLTDNPGCPYLKMSQCIAKFAWWHHKTRLLLNNIGGDCQTAEEITLSVEARVDDWLSASPQAGYHVFIVVHHVSRYHEARAEI